MKPIKNKLNESFSSSILTSFFNEVRDIASQNKGNNSFEVYQDLYFIYNGKSALIGWQGSDGNHSKIKLPLGDISDKFIFGGRSYKKEEICQFLNTSQISLKVIANNTVGKQISCIVACNSKQYDKINLGIFFTAEGTRAIKDMYVKRSQRAEASQDPELTGNQQKISDWKSLYNNIKSSYKKYKEKYGDKQAMKLSSTVNNLSSNKNVVDFIKAECGELKKSEIQAYLYSYFLDSDAFKFTKFMDRDKRFRILHDQFHPDTNA